MSGKQLVMNRLFLTEFMISRLFARSSIASTTTHFVRNAVAFKGSTSTGKKRFRQPVKDDAEYLCTHVSGSNIFKNGEDVKIKDDSEYPDWIWTEKLDGYPTLEELDPNSKEYWEVLNLKSRIRVRRLQKMQIKDAMRVGAQQRRKLELLERFKFRALPPEDLDMGFDPNELLTKPDKKLWLRPQTSVQEEEVYPDEFIKEHPEKFVKETRPWDFNPAKPRDKTKVRKWY